MRALRTAGRLAAYAATAILAGGLAVRFTTRDNVAGLSAIYYATPWAVLSACALLPALLWVRRRRFMTAGGFALVFALCTAAWAKTSFRAAPDSRAKDFRVDRKVFVMIVDFDAIVAYSRKPAFDRLFQLIDAIGDVPLIVMGDFNTPSDSVHFTELRKRMKSAFESAGSGYAKTWPMPLPVLDIDHIWVSRHFEIAACGHRTTFLSDHRAVFADLRWAERQGLN